MCFFLEIFTKKQGGHVEVHAFEPHVFLFCTKMIFRAKKLMVPSVPSCDFCSCQPALVDVHFPTRLGTIDVHVCNQTCQRLAAGATCLG